MDIIKTALNILDVIFFVITAVTDLVIIGMCILLYKTRMHDLWSIVNWFGRASVGTINGKTMKWALKFWAITLGLYWVLDLQWSMAIGGISLLIGLLARDLTSHKAKPIPEFDKPKS